MHSTTTQLFLDLKSNSTVGFMKTNIKPVSPVKTQDNLTSLVEEIFHSLIIYMVKIINPNTENDVILEKERGGFSANSCQHRKLYSHVTAVFKYS